MNTQFNPAQGGNLGAFNRSLERLASVPVDKDGDIQEPFMHFPRGTGRFDIWTYFAEKHKIPLQEKISLVA